MILRGQGGNKLLEVGVYFEVFDRRHGKNGRVLRETVDDGLV